MARVRVLCGSARSERPRTINDLFRHDDRTLLLVPARPEATRRTEQLILDSDLPGVWGRRVMTFEDFAEWLLRCEGIDATPIRDLERRLVLEEAVARARASGKLDHLGANAESEGFLTHIQRIIEQLKQAAIDPEKFREIIARRRIGSPFDPVVADVYAAYQEVLHEAGLFDRIGVLWQAALLCAEKRPATLGSMEVLLLDGFDDFTPSQFRLLKHLEPHLTEFVFGVNAEPERASARDLYALPLQTTTNLRSSFELFEQESCRESPPEAFSAYAAREIFWRDKPPPPDNLRCNLELVPCTGFVEEVETIGRKVKTLLVDHGVRHDQIVVVHRELSEVAPVLRAVFDEFGIPAFIDNRPALIDTAVGAFLLDFFDAIEQWRREAVVDVLTSPWFGPAGTSDETLRHAIPTLARAAGIIAGYDEWCDRLDRLVEELERGRDDTINHLRSRIPEARAAAEFLARQLRALKELADLFPLKTPPLLYVDATDEFLNLCAVERAIEGHPVDAVRQREQEALRTLRNILGKVRDWCGRVREDWPRAQYIRRLRQAMRQMTVPVPQERHGVLCVEPERARHLTADYIFFGGVNEGVLPRPPTLNAIYMEEDLEDLRSAGIELEGRVKHTQREMLLFHHVLNTADEKLCITWRTLSRDGKALRPSPYIRDLTELFEGHDIQRPASSESAFVPPVEEVASWRDLCNTAYGTQPRLLELFPKEFEKVRYGAAVEARRLNKAPFDHYDGVLSDGNLIEGIAIRFGKDHVFSVGRLERYATCPFSFFTERILEIKEVETPAPEFDARTRGLILHETLQRFHQRFRGRAVSEIPEDEAHEAMDKLIEEVFARWAWKSAAAPAGVMDAERKRLKAQLERYLEIERDRGEIDWKPTYFEASFGPSLRDSPDTLNRREPFPLETAEGTVLLSGRIDRVDLCGSEAAIIDYKSSIEKGEQKKIRDGRSLQLPLYALALENLLPGTTCAKAFLLRPGFAGSDGRLEGLKRGGNKPEWETRRETAVACACAYVAAIRTGQYPPMPYREVCKYCAVRRACRYEKWRIEQKTADDV